MILLDTHVLVWLAVGSRRLGRRARRRIDAALAEDSLVVSAITFWEIAMLQQKGRLELGRPAGAWRRELIDMGLGEIPVDGEIGVRAAGLEDVNGDPADRLIVATALSGASLVTADAHLLEWPGDLRRIDATR